MKNDFANHITYVTRHTEENEKEAMEDSYGV